MTKRKREGRKTLHDWDAVTPAPAPVEHHADVMEERWRKLAAAADREGAVPQDYIHDDITVPEGIEVDLDITEEMEVA